MHDAILIKLAQDIDISPSDFKKSQERFKAVKDWISSGAYTSVATPQVYLQGSFRLGTVIRPYFKEKNREFDIDQVVEFHPTQIISAESLKKIVGDRLRSNTDYKEMLEEEGTRCWTVTYKEQEGRPGFHIDILPSLKSATDTKYQIDITHKDNQSYSWKRSNPNGYYYWFKSKNVFSPDFVQREKTILLQNNRDLYSSIGDVPTQLIRSPLQRAIQILKRHRDICFSNRPNKPISIIITTIAASIRTKGNISEIINEFITYVTSRHEKMLTDKYLLEDGILDFNGERWIIPNPAEAGANKDKRENFADKWLENPDLSKAFFEWVQQLQRDVRRFSESGASIDLNLKISLDSNTENYWDILNKKLQTQEANGHGSNNELLELIHMAIEKKINWEGVEHVAIREYKIANDPISKNIALMNYYQIFRHKGYALTESQIRDVKAILNENASDPKYILGCHLLLGTATIEMLRNAVRRDASVLKWPIIRLFKIYDSSQIHAVS